MVSNLSGRRTLGVGCPTVATNVPSIAAVAELELQNFKTSTNEQ